MKAPLPRNERARVEALRQSPVGRSNASLKAKAPRSCGAFALAIALASSADSYSAFLMMLRRRRFAGVLFF